MKKLLITLALALACPPAWAQMPPPPPMPRTITVYGEASEQVPPDQAILSLTLQSKDKSLNVAKQRNDDMVKKLVALTNDFKIPKEKVATSGLYIAPEYRYDNESRGQEFIGYIVNRSIRITIDQLEIHERLLSSIIDAKIDQVNGMEFALAKPEDYAGKVRIRAYDDAKAKAEALSKAAGMKLGQPISISTTGSVPVLPSPMPAGAEARMMMADKASVAPSLPGLILVNQSVTVMFALE